MPTLKELCTRFRYIYMFIGSLVVLFALFSADPEVGVLQQLPFGAPLVASLLKLAQIVFFVTIMHLSRRALFDYVDLSDFFTKALETSEGAGRALIAIAIAMLAIALLIFAATVVL